MGQHNGLMYYTLGQRQGLGIGGRATASDEPWYVLDKRIENNQLLVGQGHDHPYLFHTELLAIQLHWCAGAPPDLPFRCSAKVRYRQQDQVCTLYPDREESVTVVFDEPVRAITPGQSVVFYDQDVCLGGGIIVRGQN